MARITVEDCLDNVENRFELVLVATKRARQIALGSEPMVTYDKDKPTVIALREIAEGLVTNEILNEPDTPMLDFGEEFAGLGADSDSDLDMGTEVGLESGSAKEDTAAAVEEPVSASDASKTTGGDSELIKPKPDDNFSAALDEALKEELKPDGDSSPAEDSAE